MTELRLAVTFKLTDRLNNTNAGTRKLSGGGDDAKTPGKVEEETGEGEGGSRHVFILLLSSHRTFEMLSPRLPCQRLEEEEEENRQ